MVYQWEIIDILKGSRVLLANLVQDQNKLTIKKDQLRFDREYSIKCSGESSSRLGEASYRIKTVEKASDIKLTVSPEDIGFSETTEFTFTVEKMANEDLTCRFFQEIDTVDIRIDDESVPSVFDKDPAVLTATLKKSDNVNGSQTVKVTAFCTTSDNKAQYIKSINVFLKPKPAEATAESVVVVTTDEEAELENIIDPVGLLIFGKDMNDE